MGELPEAAGEFEQFVAELSTRFTGIEAERVDAEIERALRQLVEHLGTDRANLGEFSPSGTSIRNTHSWARPPIEANTDPALWAEAPWLGTQLLKGESIRIERLPDDLPDEAGPERSYALRTGMKSILVIPIAVGGRFVCAIGTNAFQTRRAWSDLTVARMRTVGQILAHALYRARAEAELRARLAEIGQLHARLEAENAYLREEVDRVHGFDDIVGRSPAIRQVLARVAQVAPMGTTVLLLGETGTGKELLARAIHHRSPRRSGTLIAVNCAALAPTLIESELFGHEKGAFTGATAARVGRFELAHGGTLFLDEIGELPLDLQAKLLRVLQDGEFQRVGGTRTVKVDVRIITATNRDLVRAMAEGRFREDLYYRLGVFPIPVRPLRDRREDIPLLVWAIIERRQGKLGRRIQRVPQPVMDTLSSYAWPGNVRELENVVERALILSPGPALRLDEPFPVTGAVTTGPLVERLDHVERAHLMQVLDRHGWRIDGRGHAAEALGLHPNTLRGRMKKLGIRRPAKSS